MSIDWQALGKELAEKNNVSPTTTFAEIVKHKAETVGDKVFMTYIRDFDKGIDEKYTYRDMQLQSNQVANGLLNLGLNRGDGISIVEINSPEFLFMLFGAYKIVNLDPSVIMPHRLRFAEVSQPDVRTETMTPEELLDFLQDKLAYFQIPRFIDFVNELPKSKVHRIMKRFLKEHGVTKDTYDREKAGYKIKR